MSLVPQLATSRSNKSRLVVELATTIDDIRASQHLRYRIFGEELDADVKGAKQGFDEDEFDPYCRHLLVKEDTTGAVVGSTRLLLDSQADKAGGFYPASEFALEPLLDFPGRRLEVGRTCCDPRHRQGAAIAILWSGLADYIQDDDIDTMFG